MLHYRFRNFWFLTVQVPDGWNGIDTIVTLASNSGANSGYFNASRIILDGSYNSNSGNGNYGSSLLFQSQISGGWKTNYNIKTISDNSCRIGISNDTPLSMLHLGNCTVVNSAPVIVFGKNVSGTGYRNAFIGYTDSFIFQLVIMEIQIVQILWQYNYVLFIMHLRKH